MKYIVKKDFINKKKKINKTFIIEGYPLPSKSHKFIIAETEISNIILVNKTFAYPFASKVIRKKYDKLIKKITELFVSDEEGSAMAEVLNEIEKFREEVKRYYRKYLKKKELEEMAYKLQFLKTEATKKQQELYYNYNLLNTKTSNRTR